MPFWKKSPSGLSQEKGQSQPDQRGLARDNAEGNTARKASDSIGDKVFDLPLTPVALSAAAHPTGVQGGSPGGSPGAGSPAIKNPHDLRVLSSSPGIAAAPGGVLTRVTGQAQRSAVPTNEQAEVVIEEGVTLRGKLFLERPSVIRGCFVGEIYSQSSVIIAETASTQALIVADYVTIQGKQEGEIRAKKGLQVSRSGEIVGRISTASLGLEQGSQFRGSSMMVSESA